MDKQEIILGSGRLYLIEYTGFIPSDEVIEADENQIGAISGGASVEYKPSFYTAKDDLGTVSKTIVTEEEATLKSGVCTFNAHTLAKLSATSRVTEVGNKRILKIGGVGNFDGKMYAIRFVHTSGKYKVTIVGQNQAGFTLSFAKDKETIIDAEFSAQPADNDGTLIIFEESITDIGKLNINLKAGETAGTTIVASISPTLISGNGYKYQIDDEAIAVALDDVCTTGWEVLTVNETEIEAAAGEIITVVEVDSSNKAKKVGTVTVIDNIG